MTDMSMVDYITRLKLKLLEKVQGHYIFCHEQVRLKDKLENERETLENAESPFSTARSMDGNEDALQNALRRRKDLLQKLREQHLLEEFSQPYVLSGGQRKNYRPQPGPIYLPSPMASPPEPPRIIQHTMPQQPATIIQQLPPQLPLITQIPLPQPLLAPRSGSIKEDMVEMMLMQNAQMHQIIMQNMMLKVLPPMAFSQPAGTGPPLLQQAQQDPKFAAPVVVKAEKPRPSAVHHHHHYPVPGAQGVPSQLPPAACSMWPPVMPANLMGRTEGFPFTVHHMTGPTSTIPAMHSDRWSPPQPVPGCVDIASL